jgi:hypothetical protein
MGCFGFRKRNKRIKYEELVQEVRYLRQRTGLTVMVLESRLAQMEERLTRILGERERLWCEVTHLKNQFEMVFPKPPPENDTRDQIQ